MTEPCYKDIDEKDRCVLYAEIGRLCADAQRIARVISAWRDYHDHSSAVDTAVLPMSRDELMHDDDVVRMLDAIVAFRGPKGGVIL